MTKRNPNKTSSGKRRPAKIKHCLEVAGLAIVVEVPVTYALENPHEPLLDGKTVRFLDEIARRAKAGDLKWLVKRAQVYESLST